MRKLVAVLFTGLLSSGSCFANWELAFIDGNYTGTITYGSAQKSISEPIVLGSAPTGPLGTIATNLYVARNNMVNTLSNYASTYISQLSASGFQASLAQPLTLSGPLTATITGFNGPGNVVTNQLLLSGPTLNALVSGSGSEYGINVSCSISIAANNVQISAAYNPISGAVITNSPMTYANLNPTTNTSCSSNIDFIPFLGNFIDQWAANKVNANLQGAIAGIQQQFIKAILPYGNGSNLGIAAAMKSGNFVINGVDWGQYIQNNFATLFVGQTITLSMSPYTQPTAYYATAAEPSDVTVTIPTLTLTFSNVSSTLQFSLTDTEYYTYNYYCPSGTTKCIRPY